MKSLEAFTKAADGRAKKIIIPSDIQAIAGLTKAVTEVAKNDPVTEYPPVRDNMEDEEMIPDTEYDY